ncbi:uncharacterized protein LOC142345493 isoform X2 [Convolutriloba macropyga]|uniref:uncharacterized protein LOC142345493 isoform X2 n=1 Tax=Convolutriloba macropyga TaxID=536237 RepID=UPI003F52034E
MQFLEMSSLIEVCVLAVIIALTSQLVSDVDGFCAPDTGTITGADGLCFYFGRNRLNWTDADAECKRRRISDRDGEDNQESPSSFILMKTAESPAPHQ